MLMGRDGIGVYLQYEFALPPGNGVAGKALPEVEHPRGAWVCLPLRKPCTAEWSRERLAMNTAVSALRSVRLEGIVRPRIDTRGVIMAEPECLP